MKTNWLIPKNILLSSPARLTAPPSLSLWSPCPFPPSPFPVLCAYDTRGLYNRVLVLVSALGSLHSPFFDVVSPVSLNALSCSRMAGTRSRCKQTLLELWKGKTVEWQWRDSRFGDIPYPFTGKWMASEGGCDFSWWRRSGFGTSDSNLESRRNANQRPLWLGY